MFNRDNISHGVHDPMVCHDIDPYLIKVNVIVYTLQKFFPGHNLSQVTWTGMILHLIVVHAIGGVLAGGGGRYLSR